MKDKLIEKVLKEFDEKLKNIEPETIAIYLMIASYVTEEDISNEYMAFLLKQSNSLECLFTMYQLIKSETNNYDFVKGCLMTAETNFLKTSESNHYE